MVCLRILGIKQPFSAAWNLGDRGDLKSQILNLFLLDREDELIDPEARRLGQVSTQQQLLHLLLACMHMHACSFNLISVLLEIRLSSLLYMLVFSLKIQYCRRIIFLFLSLHCNFLFT
jgi:hypothetical protein